MLTPKGLEEKGRLTLRFLKRKLSEYEEINYSAANRGVSK